MSQPMIGGVYREGGQGNPPRRYIIAYNFDYVAVPAQAGGWTAMQRWPGRLISLTRLPAEEAARVLALVGAPTPEAA